MKIHEPARLSSIRTALLAIASILPLATAQDVDRPAPRRAEHAPDDPAAPAWVRLELAGEIPWELAGGARPGEGSDASPSKGIIGRLEAATEAMGGAPGASTSAGDASSGFWRSVLSLPVRTRALLGDRGELTGVQLELGVPSLELDPAMDSEAIDLVVFAAEDMHTLLSGAMLPLTEEARTALEFDRSGRVSIEALLAQQSFWRGAPGELEVRLPVEPTDVAAISIRVGPGDPASRRALGDITTYDPIHVVVSVPRAKAAALGEALTVAIRSTATGDESSISVSRRRAGTKGPLVYTHEEPVTLEGGGAGGDSAEVAIWEFSWGDMDPLDTENGDIVTFTCEGAQTSVRVWDTWVQQGIAAERAFFDTVYAFLLQHRQNPALSPADRAAMDAKLQLIDNGRLLLAYQAKGNENYTDYTRLLVAQGFHRLLLMDPAEWGAKFALPNAHFGIVQRSEGEIDTTNGALREGRERFRSSLYSTVAKATLGSYQLFTTLVGANQVYTAITGTDCMGRRVDLTHRVLAGVDAGSQLLLVGSLTGMGARTASAGNPRHAANAALAEAVRCGRTAADARRASAITLGTRRFPRGLPTAANSGRSVASGAEASMGARAGAAGEAAASGREAAAAASGIEEAVRSESGIGAAASADVPSGAPGSTASGADAVVRPSEPALSESIATGAEDGLPLSSLPARRGARIDESDFPPTRAEKSGASDGEAPGPATGSESGETSTSSAASASGATGGDAAASTAAETRTNIPGTTSSRPSGGIAGSISGPRTDRLGEPDLPGALDRPARRYSREELAARLERERAERARSSARPAEPRASDEAASAGRVEDSSVSGERTSDAAPAPGSTERLPELEAPDRPRTGNVRGADDTAALHPDVDRPTRTAAPPRSGEPASGASDRTPEISKAEPRPLDPPPTDPAPGIPMDPTPTGPTAGEGSGGTGNTTIVDRNAPTRRIPEEDGAAETAVDRNAPTERVTERDPATSNERMRPEPDAPLAADTPTLHPPFDVRRVDRPELLEATWPKPGESWKAPNGETFVLGERLDAGRNANARVFPILEGEHRGRALKVLPAEELVHTGYDAATQTSKLEAYPVLDDILHGSELLNRNGIPQLRIHEVSSQGELVYIVQDLFPEGHVIPGHGRKLNYEQEGAILDLFERLVVKDLIWEDARGGNVLLVPTGDRGWQAVMFDTDRIVQWSEVPSPRLQHLMDLPIKLPAKEGVDARSTSNILSHEEGYTWQPRSAVEYMTKVLEYKNWIRFDRRAYRFERPAHGGGLDPERVRRRFPILDYVRYPSPEGRAPTVLPAEAPVTLPDGHGSLWNAPCTCGAEERVA